MMDIEHLLLSNLERKLREVRSVLSSGTKTANITTVPPLFLAKTKKLIDDCITSYLQERLKHDDGLVASPAISPPTSPSWVPHSVETWPGTLTRDEGKDAPPQPPPHRTPPIHLSRRPVGASPRHEFKNANAAPFSSSSRVTSLRPIWNSGTKTLVQIE